MTANHRWALAAVLFVVVSLIALTFAKAHDAPSGWAYGWECCSGIDCQQVQDDNSIHATSVGWLIDATGETIPYGDARLKKSGDEHFHRCATRGNPTTHCLYVPGFGS